MAAYDTGYEDERFQHPVGHSLHCTICTNVIKDPVMCRHNEHIFCRACITRHLVNYQTCPSCMEPLTVDTLIQAPRGIRNLLAELKIHCEFSNRGCTKFIELGDLERHVRDCGFAPAVCSNEGCQHEVNKQDLLHHETAVCKLCRLKCHSCNELRKEIGTIKINLTAMNKRLNENERKILEKFDLNKKVVQDNLVAKVKLVQEQLQEQVESNRRLEADVLEMKKTLNTITKQLEKVLYPMSPEVLVEEIKSGVAGAVAFDREPMVVIAGGRGARSLNSVEVFSLFNGTWRSLQPMMERRSSTFSVVHNNQIFVMGGSNKKSMETLSVDAVQANQSITWKKIPAELPSGLMGHCGVVCNGQLIVIGGNAIGEGASDSISTISLTQPYTSTLLATMSQGRWYHGVALFDDKIVIVGGRESASYDTALKSVVMYDVMKNECVELTPLPYALSEMATVKWGDDSVIIMGGRNGNSEVLDTVLMYNIKTQTTHMLPDMKYKRYGCVAGVIRDTVIIMGGEDESAYLQSVESFRFDRYTWEELPEMHEGRSKATAVVC